MTTITVKIMEKVVRAPDGTMRKLVSYDGETWRMDLKAEKRRIQAGINLQGKRWKKKVEKKFDIAVNPGVQTVPLPVILPVINSESAFLGKDRGKKHKDKMNLHRQIVKEVKIKRPVHKHRCHGKMYLCSCDTPYFRRLCGDTICMKDALKGAFAK